MNLSHSQVERADSLVSDIKERVSHKYNSSLADADEVRRWHSEPVLLKL